MTQAEPIPGQAVSLPATLASFPRTDLPIERQAVTVRLKDGQSIETNITNLEWLPHSAPNAEPAAAGPLGSPDTTAEGPPPSG